jgi:hypothetical protein
MMPLQPSDKGVLFLVQVFRTTLYLGYGRKKKHGWPNHPMLETIPANRISQFMDYDHLQYIG